MSKQQGPLLPDQVFFGHYVSSNVSGLHTLKDAVLCSDFALCRKIFADHVRSMLDPEVFFSCLPMGNAVTAESIIRKAELAMRHIMAPCGIPHDFGKAEVDWFSNPTYNGYQEWTWQLSRHEELLTLARAYRYTKEEKYAAECLNLFDSWVKQATRHSVNNNNSQRLCWRSIECGIRMSLVWPEIIHSVIHSPSLSDDLITDWCKSVCEHALLLRNYHKPNGNWLIMEMSGLLHIATLYSCFREKDEWFAYAENKLREELQKQVYPDGFQYELSSSYQHILVIHYGRVIRLLRGYGKSVPEEFEVILAKMLHIYVKLMRPSMSLPDLNDGSLRSVKELVAPYIDLFPDDTVLRWAGSEGKNGVPPAEKSVILPYAGIAVFRSGWGREDTWLCFDGGPFGTGHQHEDKLNVLLHTHGKYVLTEGNNYAYDSSEMRKYVLSTRAHNTALVDGMEQNRRKNYFWASEMINQYSGLNAKLSDFADSARAVYDEGYGENQDRSVKHDRSVYFVKKAEKLPPFALIVDRLSAESGTHSYALQYHLDAEAVIADGLNVTALPLRIFAPNDRADNAELTVEYGVKEPQWNGWTADSVIQGDFRPIYIVKYILRGQTIRWVTLLWPYNGENDMVAAVDGGIQISDTDITVTLRDGSKIYLDEAQLL